MDTSPQARLAVLIDADNAQASLATALLAEVAKYGRATTKRAYGDWTTTSLGSWKKTLLEHAIQPMQQFPNTIGKNATDSALIIDAMDLLYTGRFDGFCIVSSDSDFTRLASRIRETGLLVYGFGERKTPQAFVSACDKFVYVEVLRGAKAAVAKPAPASKPAPAVKPGKRAASAKPAASAATLPAETAAETPLEAVVEPAIEKADARRDPALHALLSEALDDAADEDGWAGLGALGSLVAKRAPDFDSRNYGYRKLSDLIKTLGLFEISERGSDGKPKAIYLRNRRGGTPG